MSTENLTKIKELREKAIDGSITIEDFKYAIQLVRGGRYSACFASAGAAKKKSTKNKKTAVIEESSEGDKND